MTAHPVHEPLLVEILGPAAAGKTTLVRALCAGERGVRGGLELEPLSYIRHLVARVGAFLLGWTVRRDRGRWFDVREMRSMARLDAWAHVLRRKGGSGEVATVLDHGPIYRLARLREFGPPYTSTARFQRWWRESHAHWMGALHMVVWLDAPDDVLLRRVGERGHWYLSSDVPAEAKHEFLSRYRRAFEDVLGDVGEGGPRVLRIRSDDVSIEECVATVLAAFNDAGASSARDGRVL